jgi:hypothetical protein
VSVAVAVKVHGVPLDPSIVLADVTVRSGRERADDGLSPSSATVDLLSPAPLGSTLRIADAIAITANGVARFAGRVAELTQDARGGQTATTLVAVGALARLPRLPVALPLPAATAAARVSAIFAGAGIPVAISGGTTYNLAAYGATGDDPTTADTVVAAVMADTGAIVADGGDGTVIVQFPEARISGEKHTPDAARTSSELVWQMSDDVVNDASVEYGPQASRAVARATNSISIETYDVHATRLSSGLGDAGSATRRATSIVSRLAAPAWEVRSVESWDDAALTYHVGALMTLGPLSSAAPVPSPWIGILEGWTERYQPDDAGGIIGVWDLAMGDPRHSAETLVWANATPAEHWATVNPATSWQEVISNSDL